MKESFIIENGLLLCFAGEESEVVIPDGVTSIGVGAFNCCSGLTSITIPDSVTRIGDYAFVLCSGLTSMSIPDSVTSIGDYAFDGCSGLTSISIPDSVTSIGSSAFGGCSGLTSISIPDSVTSIGVSAFNGCSGLTSITVEHGNPRYHSVDNCLIETASKTLILGCKNSIIPDDGSVASIGDRAFDFCSGLTSITIPDSVTSIGDKVFRNCNGLTSITVESGNPKYHSAGNCIIETASKTLIAGCQNSIIPDDGSVTSIGWGAFEGCSVLISITIPDNVTSIGSDAFSYCYGLTSITISDRVTIIGAGAFSYCSGLTNVTIPNSVTSIGDYAFFWCSGLTSISIPDSVTSIGDRAFDFCSGLTSITVEQGNSNYYSASNCIIETASKKLIAGCQNSVIPDERSVTSIGDRAFSGCSGLKCITVPNGVISLGDYTFCDCNSLKSISIPDSVTGIGSNEFFSCRSLININYQGTMLQWRAINKGIDWSDGTGDFTITCTDGVLDKQGNPINNDKQIKYSKTFK